MGLTKQYLRYVASAVFGLIGSQKGNIVFVTLRGEKGRYVAVPACEHVFIWDLRKGEKILILQGLKQEVTCLCPSPDGLHLAVGYEDGSIRIFSLLSGEGNVTFNGHRAAITSLKYDQLGGRLASGSKDTDIIVWDVINESGLYRLKGHKDAITQALFLREKNLLVSSGKDTVVKWWDLDTQHCFKTMVGHRTEVWGLVLVSEEKRLITGASDSELRAWDIAYLQEIKDLEEPEPKKIKGSSPGIQDTCEAEDGALEVDEAPEDRIFTCRKAGSILREGRDRVVNLSTDRTGRMLACHGIDSVLEVFCILSREEIQKKMDKKMKKARKKARLNSGKGEEEDLEVSVEMTLQDEIQRVTNIKTSAKIKSFDLILSPQGELKAVFLLQNNLVELYSLNPSAPAPQPVRTSRVTLGGHRSDVRTLSFSSDNIAVLSAAADSIKIWNRSTLQCIRTMTCEYALCSFFVPGDRQVVIGTKTGRLQLYDLASGTLLETVDAHDGALWSMSLSPDQRGFVTGGADKSVKFWDFELVKDENSTQKRLSVKQTRTLQLDEEVLSVRYSPHQNLLAVSLLDCTVKIFYVDTLKFFLSLYGHKLPVICMDISYDGALIATGSADRNVKIWGLDFGDCHKSLFAHDDSVMYLQFVPKSHLFFTAGKDRKIKQWDADNFEHIQTLEGHHQEIWCLAVSPNGDYVVSSSHDKSLRLWERTREPLILEEEREMQREAEYEESVAKEDQPAVPGETQGENYFTGKKTIETVKAAERIMEAVELYREETAKMKEHKAICKAAGKEVPLPTNPILMAYGNISPSAYVLEIFKGIKSSELEESLLVLPFSYVPPKAGRERRSQGRSQESEPSVRDSGGHLIAALDTMDLHLFDYSEPGNFSDISWPCNSSDCIVVDTMTCPNMANKSVLLYTLSFIYIFIFVIGMIANSVVVWVNIQAKTTGYDTHCYILNLAIADLWVVVTIPVWVVSLVQHNQWPMGELTCKVSHLIFSINLFGSIFFLTCMSVDRYLSITYFTNTSSHRKKVVRRVVCVLVWLLAFCVSLPDTYYLKTVTSASNNETYCRSFYPEHSVKEWLISMELMSVVLGFVIPFCIIAVFYFLLARALSASGDQETHSSRKIIFSYVVVFLVCWLPYHVVVLLDVCSILHYIPFTCQLENFLFSALHITQCLSLVHCCVNPVLYSFINRNYRYELMKAFIFKYSAKTGLTKLIDASRVSETEYSALEQNTK